MPLPSFLRSDPASVAGSAAATAAAGDDPPVIRAARRRARQRLVGAALLLTLGIVAFSLLFETEPRPLPADTSVRLAQRDTGMVRSAEPPAGPAQAVAGMADAAAQPASAASPVATAPALAVPAASPASAPAASAAPGFAASPALAPAPAPAPVPAPARTPAPAPAVAAAAPPAAQPASAAAAEARFVVQVGAFSDTNTLRQARAKVERLGLTTYTQVIGSGSTQRTRVRVGPFDSRAEAEAAAGKLKAGGLPANILKL